MTAINNYFDDARVRLTDLASTQMNAIEKVAQVGAEAIGLARPIHIFDSGHLISHEFVDRTGGLAAYSCSLQPQTPFRGFSMLAAEFHSAQLPPIDAAKGRRYSLEASKADKTPPYFLTTSAQSLLTKAGATVALIPVPGDHTPRFTVETVDLLAKAVHWLESGK